MRFLLVLCLSEAPTHCPVLLGNTNLKLTENSRTSVFSEGSPRRTVSCTNESVVFVLRVVNSDSQKSDPRKDDSILALVYDSPKNRLWAAQLRSPFRGHHSVPARESGLAREKRRHETAEG